MIFALFAFFSSSINICFSTIHIGICPDDAITISSFEKIEDIIKQINFSNDERHLNIYIENTYKTPILLNLNNFLLNSITATLKGNKDSSFAVIDFGGRLYDDESIFSYDGVTVHPVNISGLSGGCLYTQNVDFQFSGFDSGKIFSKYLHKKVSPKSIISFDPSEGYTVFEFKLLPSFDRFLIKENSVVLGIEGQVGNMTVNNLRKGMAFFDQESKYEYKPIVINTDVTSDEIDLPFFCIRCVKSTDITIGKFPKQPSGIPAIGLDVQTNEEIIVKGSSSTYSKFVLFDTQSNIRKKLKVNHADIVPYHYGNDKIDKMTFIFDHLSISYGNILKISDCNISIETNEIQSTAYSLRQVDQFISYDDNKFQQIFLSKDMNYLKLTEFLFTISNSSDESPEFQIESNSNLHVLVIQAEESPTNLTIVTSTQSLSNLPTVELLLSKESMLNVVSSLRKDQDPHFVIFGDNIGKPVTIQSTAGNSFIFGLTDDIKGDFILNGAKVLLQDVEIINIGQIYVKNTEFTKMNIRSNPIISINNLYVNASFINQIPHLSVISNFHILGDAKNGQIFPCHEGPNVYLDIPTGFDKLEVDSLDIILTDYNHKKSVVFNGISKNGHIYFSQKPTSPKLYSIELMTVPANDSQFGCSIFEFIDNPSIANTVNFVGNNWNKFIKTNLAIIELRSQNKLTVQFDGILPIKIVNKPGGELTLVPSKTTFGFTELDLSGKMSISSSSKEIFSVFINTFGLNSTASFPLDRRTEINANEINFDLGAFSLIQTSKIEIVSGLTSIFLHGNSELRNDYELTFDSNKTKNFVMLGSTASCSLSIENSTINYKRNQHTLTFKNFDKEANVAISSNDSKIGTEITSFHLNANSTFVFDNNVVLKGVFVMDYNSVVYARNNGKIVFSPKHDFITYYNLTSEYFPTIYSEKVPFEGKPFALSLYHPGEKELGSKFFNWVGMAIRGFCFPDIDCNDFLSCIDVEHPFRDGNYSFKPVCVEFEAKKCVSFNITKELYKPTPTRLPMPTSILSTTQTPSRSNWIPTRTESPKTATPPPPPPPTTTDGGGALPDDWKPKKKKINIVLIAGVAAAGVVVVGVLIGVLVYCLKKKSKKGGFESFDPSLKDRLTGDNVL